MGRNDDGNGFDAEADDILFGEPLNVMDSADVLLGSGGDQGQYLQESDQ